ncbi:MAG: hypothetical protein CBB99_06090 [Bacteroidetes bacterium TMED39]|nr:MAG: hypothetical protein CBB99_06090 [Bacteroidetes bacterium TMED39]
MIVPKLALIINPKSGGGVNEEKLIYLKDFFVDSPYSFEIYYTQKPKDFKGIKDFIESDVFKILTIAGGDGTMSEVLNSGIDVKQYLWHVIPIGTGNDFVRMFKKYDWQKAMLYGFEKKVDLWSLNGDYFLNALGFGFDGAVAADTHKNFAIAWPHKWKYYLAIINNILTFKEFEAEVFSKGQRMYSSSTFMLTLANGAFFGNGFNIAPNAQVDDHLLNLYIIKKISGLKRIVNIQKAKKGKHTSLSVVKHFQENSFEIQFNSKVSGQIDGELVRFRKAFISHAGSITFLLNK